MTVLVDGQPLTDEETRWLATAMEGYADLVADDWAVDTRPDEEDESVPDVERRRRRDEHVARLFAFAKRLGGATPWP